MKRLPLEALRNLWEEEGIHGDWRRMLKDGYRSGELYFEFGLMPEKKKACNYRLILDHEVPVWLCSGDTEFRGEYVIRPDDARAGDEVVSASDNIEGFRYHTLYVTEAAYNAMLADAARIFASYRDDEIVCFWSIPNKWFADLALIQFITENIVATDYYESRPQSRSTWYWP